LTIMRTIPQKSYWLMNKLGGATGGDLVDIDFHTAIYCWCNGGTIDIEFDLNGAGEDSPAGLFKSYWENRVKNVANDFDAFLTFLPADVIEQWFKAVDSVQGISEDKDTTDPEVESSGEND